ncbi:multiple sugar transport system permease protein [Catenulispora sp. GAS73]|uniref:carbohydrate ABC transporter permease n=1 Tax=Catenulispora sp. GAS73 TaxID=3156269 RepID=UPI003511E92A
MRRPKMSVAATAILAIGSVYTLLPVLWVLIAATKSGSSLFNSSTAVPGTSLLHNISQLNSYRSGLFWRWMYNTLIYAGGGALLGTALSGLTGFALAKYEFRGKKVLFNVLLGGVMVPAVALAVPTYLMLAKVGMAGGYLSVLLPSVAAALPYGSYLGRIFAASSVPDEVLEAGRIEGAGEWRLMLRIAAPMMVPGLVTIFLFQFISIWNNFMLPFIMLGDDRKFPLTVGLFSLLNQGAEQPALYNLVITGALLSILPLIVLFLTLQRYWRSGIVAGAVK